MNYHQFPGNTSAPAKRQKQDQPEPFIRNPQRTSIPHQNQELDLKLDKMPADKRNASIQIRMPEYQLDVNPPNAN